LFTYKYLLVSNLSSINFNDYPEKLLTTKA